MINNQKSNLSMLREHVAADLFMTIIASTRVPLSAPTNTVRKAIAKFEISDYSGINHAEKVAKTKEKEQ